MHWLPMHRAKLIFLGLLLAGLSALGFAATAQAQSFRSGNNVTVPSGQTVNSTVFAAGRTVDIAGNVNGDVFCAGSNVTVSGRVRGDVICAAQNLDVTGQVSGDVRLAGQNVTLGSQVNGNATITAQNFTQASGSTVQGDITIGGQDAALHGKVGRDVAGGAGTLTITNAVGRNLQANVTNLHLGSGANITGNITYTSNNTLQKDNGAQVGGTVTRHAPSKQAGKSHAAAAWLFWLYLYLACVVAAVVLVLLFPRVFGRTALAARMHFGTTLLAGLIASIVVPVILVILMFTVIGIPLAIVLGAAWLLVWLLSGAFAAYLVGQWIFRGRVHPVLTMLVGAAILFLVDAIPFIGWAIWLVAGWVGVGMQLMLLKHTRGSLHEANQPPPEQDAKPSAA